MSSEREGIQPSNFVCGWSTMTHITDTRGDLQPESSGWLFESPVADGGGMLWQPQYRTHNLLLLLVISVGARAISAHWAGPELPLITASAFIQLDQYTSSPGRRAYCYENHPFLPKVVAVTIANTHCVYNIGTVMLSWPGLLLLLLLLIWWWRWWWW